MQHHVLLLLLNDACSFWKYNPRRLWSFAIIGFCYKKENMHRDDFKINKFLFQGAVLKFVKSLYVLKASYFSETRLYSFL